jgi:hypothetical protein
MTATPMETHVQINLIFGNGLFRALHLQFVILQSLYFQHYTISEIHTSVKVNINIYNYNITNNLHVSITCILDHIKKMHAVKRSHAPGNFPSLV